MLVGYMNTCKFTFSLESLGAHVSALGCIWKVGICICMSGL